MKLKRIAVVFLTLILVATTAFTACGNGSGPTGGTVSGGTVSSGAQGTESSSGPGKYPPATVHLPEPSGKVNDDVGEKEVGNASIDYGNAADGYVIVTCEGFEERLKVQVKKDDVKYNYDIESDGVPVVYPLQLGDGTYEVAVWKQQEGTSYLPVLTQTIDNLTLDSEFAPFLIPMQLIEYDANSASVAKAFELAQGCNTDIEVVTAVFDFMRDNITYDKEKADLLKNQTGYIPNPDETLASGTGICYDYASLAAAMLRANGIPCKLITGNVSDGTNSLYHAWNMVWVESEGWITKEIQVDPDTWELIDTTFASSLNNKELADYIGDGSGYQERLVY